MKKINKTAPMYVDPSIYGAGVYIGGLDALKLIPISWHKDKDGILFLTLAEIEEQVKEKTGCPLITLIFQTPLYSSIYQCGNYKEGEWWWLGDVAGYA